MRASGPGHRPEAFAAALAALRRRERSIAEITGWLQERDYPGEEIEDAVDRLIECRELDDERFAELFAEDKRDLSDWGPERIAAALRERGLDSALIDRVTAEDRDRQLDRAVGLLLGRRMSIGDDRERERALGMLTRRGFGYELSHDAIRRAVAEADAA